MPEPAEPAVPPFPQGSSAKCRQTRPTGQFPPPPGPSCGLSPKIPPPTYDSGIAPHPRHTEFAAPLASQPVDRGRRADPPRFRASFAPRRSRSRQLRSRGRSFRHQRIWGRSPVKTGPYALKLQARVTKHIIPSQPIRILDASDRLSTHGGPSRSGPGTGPRPSHQKHRSTSSTRNTSYPQHPASRRTRSPQLLACRRTQERAQRYQQLAPIGSLMTAYQQIVSNHRFP